MSYDDDEKLPPRFGPKPKKKRVPTKRHLQDKLKSVQKELARWEDSKAKMKSKRTESWWSSTVDSLIHMKKKEIKMLEGMIAES